MKRLKLISKILVLILTFLFGIIMVGGQILLENADAVNTVFGSTTQVTVPDESDADADLEYYKSAFSSVKDVKKNGANYCETVVREGAVLLKNENNALPLAEGSAVSLFSTSSVNPFLSGTGSSGASGVDDVSLKEGFTTAGLEVNDDLWDWYASNFSRYGWKKSGGAVGTQVSIGDAKWDQINTPAKTNSAYGDAAIFVLSRSGGEGIDNTIYNGDPSDYQDGNYLKLSPTERDVLENLNKLKGTVFSKIIVLMNTANQVECAFVDDPTLGIDAAVWVGMFGSTGAYAIGDLLVGNVNFSGRLSDTFWKHHYLNPVNANYAILVGTTNNVTQWVLTSEARNGYNIVYQEGVYMGYRYTETRYEDVVLGTEKTGNYNYNEVVSYPFGYGLSYSSFEYGEMNVQKTFATAANGLKENEYTVSVKVTNTGKVAGKEVVQIYLQRPYTEYDRQNGIEKPAVELVGFAKTKTLAAGESETVSVAVSERTFAVYDAYKAGTYVVDEGDYYFTAAKDAHDAVNNVLAAKGKTVESGMDAEGNAALVKSFGMDFDDKTYSVSSVTGNDIVNQFNDADLKLYEGAGANKDNLTYVTRKDWEGTVKFGLTADNQRTNAQFSVAVTNKMQEDLAWSRSPIVEKDDGEYPTYGSTKTSYKLIDLRAYDDGDGDPTNDEWIPYDDPMWEDLLDQLTWDETVDLLSHGYRKTAALSSIGKPETIDHNGATGPNQKYNGNSSSGVNQGFAVRTDDEDKAQTPIVYPCNGLIASTFNLTFADFYGRQWGEDCLWSGYAGLYGMGINTHRSPFGGRNFEYYSEDPVLAGKIAAQMTKGMATRGVYVYLKHCVLNDQETYRCGGFTWANEQTIREIYLRAFQIAIEEGGAQCVMGGLNSIGMKWTGVQGFFNTVLRGEFGMTGHVVTDSYDCYNGSFVKGVYYGNDIPDGTVSTGKESFEYASPANGGYSKMAWAMRESAHRVLYTVVHSNAMNNISTNTHIIKITPAWEKLLTGLEIGIGIAWGGSLILLGTMFYLDIRKKHSGKGRKS